VEEILCDRELVTELAEAYGHLVHELGRVYYLQDIEAIDQYMAEVDRLKGLLGLDDE
jgi:hypothetical protein